MAKPVRIYTLKDLYPDVEPGGRGMADILPDDLSELMEMEVQRIRPGNMGLYHVHKKSDNIWIVLEGELEAVIGGERYFTRAGEVIFMPAGVPHQTGNRGDVDMLAIEIYCPPHGKGPMGAPGKDAFFSQLPPQIRDAKRVSA